ncbi:alpha/beta fold hydrolase [Actinomadura scrupuli]|uniref:alpha/beta fold hydrolase n=1 Tax=Actinomadura scrupuli TaxID=559629 RepID=UPI003D96B791
MNRLSSFDGTSLAYRVWDGDSALPPVVLHHGFVVDTEVNWVITGIVDALRAAGRTVVGLDARGHGASGKPHDPQRYGEETMARDLVLLLDVLGAPEVHLVGYSMGAVVSLVAASRDPRITRLVVGGVGAGIVEVGGVDTRAMPLGAVIAALTADEPSALDDPGAAGFRALADGTGADRAALAAHAAAVRPLDIPLAAISAPTLVLAGDADPLAARPEVLAAAIPGARLALVPGDHLTAVPEPRFAASIVEFLAG